MTVFGHYASFYDALYADKDYAAECRYLERLLAAESPRPVRTLLDLGCGTGNHDLRLAKRGFQVTGVDRSAGMLAAFRRKAEHDGLDARAVRGDVRRVRLDRRFDAVVSMFAVMGYQTSNADARAAFETAAIHLKRGAPFLFDVWYGPSVLRDPPGDRTKRMEDGDTAIERTTTCRTDEAAHCVDITFDTRRLRGRKTVERSTETHRMRFFFPQELELLTELAGLRLTRLVPFMKTQGKPGPDTWTVMAVARKR